MITDFPGKRPDENVLMVIRKHPVVYIRLVVVFIVINLVPVSIFMALWSNSFPLSSGGTLATIGYLGALFYVLYGLAILLIAWLNEEFDLFILTDHRLIDIEQVSFLKRNVATTPLIQIQDTTSEINGIVGTLLNYGTIDVKTAAGNASDFNIDYVHDPSLIAREILNYAHVGKQHSHEDEPLPDPII